MRQAIYYMAQEMYICRKACFAVQDSLYSRRIASGGILASRRVPSHPTSTTASSPPKQPIGQMTALA